VGCVFAVLGLFFPRLALILLWLFTTLVTRAFDSFVLPLLGVIFLPYTTLAYVLVWRQGTGVTGALWLWVALGVLLDLGSFGGGARRRRR